MKLRSIVVRLALALAACNAPTPPEPGDQAAPAATATPPAAAVTTAAAPADREHPTLAVDTLDGKRFDLASKRGKWVVVNFWATWCGPCLKEMPALSALDTMREHIDVVGLAYEDTTKEEMLAFLEKRPVSYPIALVDVYDPPKDFETPVGLPTTYLIGPDGKVAKRFLGPVEPHDIEAAIAAAGGPAAPKEG
jgi:thiol-disulfide isomerase/thioredoxin